MSVKSGWELFLFCLVIHPGMSQTPGSRGLRLDPGLPVPAGNALTREKAALGKRLFFDRRLSADGSVSCSSCHEPEKAFTDGLAVSRGVFLRTGKRNAPTMVNRGFGESHFWDGRAATLEEQVLKPIQDADEMDLALPEAVKRLDADADYVAQFRAVFGSAPTAENLSHALSSYVRTIRSGDSPFDRFLLGTPGGLPALELEGLRLFRDRANCTACHSGPDFTDHSFHNTGVAWRGGRLLDEGRYKVTGRVYHRGAFKTPTLRELARSAPYMHDGSLASIEDVIEFYDRGGNPNPWLDEQIKPLHLSAADKAAIAAFLRSLSGSVRDGFE